MLDISNGTDLVSGEEELPLKARRLLDGECTRCGAPGPHEANLCGKCTSEGTTYTRELRHRRRANGRCAFCPRRSRTYRCKGCTRKHRDQRRSVSKRRRSVEQPTTQQPKLVAKVEVDARYPDGRVRMREVGRGTRGAPNRQQLEADDLRVAKLANREQAKAIAAIEEANRLPLEMPRVQRDAARRAALAGLDLANRLNDEVLDRNKYGQEAQMLLTTREQNRRNRPR